MDRNVEGEEIVRFVHRARLAINHPRFQFSRFRGRRTVPGEGILFES